MCSSSINYFSRCSTVGTMEAADSSTLGLLAGSAESLGTEAALRETLPLAIWALSTPAGLAQIATARIALYCRRLLCLQVPASIRLALVSSLARGLKGLDAQRQVLCTEHLLLLLEVTLFCKNPLPGPYPLNLARCLPSPPGPRHVEKTEEPANEETKELA